MDAHSRCASELLLGRRRCLGDEGLRLGISPHSHTFLHLPFLQAGAERVGGICDFKKLWKCGEIATPRYAGSECVFYVICLPRPGVHDIDPLVYSLWSPGGVNTGGSARDVEGESRVQHRARILRGYVSAAISLRRGQERYRERRRSLLQKKNRLSFRIGSGYKEGTCAGRMIPRARRGTCYTLNPKP
jgi:hypothetical protein